MNLKHSVRARALAAVAALAALPIAAPCLAQIDTPGPVGTAFNYQGRIKLNGTLINQFEVDMQITLWDAPCAIAPCGGAQVGPTLFFDGMGGANHYPRITPVNGLFNASLDFGSGVFDGNARWLQVAVRFPPGGMGQYANVYPRQALNPAPYSVHALSGGEWVRLPNNTLVYDEGGVFIDSPLPDPPVLLNVAGDVQLGSQTDILHITTGGDRTVVIHPNTNAVDSRSWIEMWGDDPLGNADGVLRLAGTSVELYYASTTTSAGAIGMVLANTGNVGIGTTSPAVPLHIVGGNVATGNGDGGVLRIGPDSSAPSRYLVVDGDDLMAFDGTTESTLWLNSNGGDVIILNQSMVTPLGKVGIGRVPTTHRLEVQGGAGKTDGSGMWATISDKRVKTDIEEITGALAILHRIPLMSFRFTDTYLHDHPTLEDRTYVNVLAQDFAQVFPDDVFGSGEFLADGQEILQVDPWPLTIYAAAAVKELHGIVNIRDTRIAALEAANDTLQATVQRQQQDLNDIKSQLASIRAQIASIPNTQQHAEGGTP